MYIFDLNELVHVAGNDTCMLVNMVLHIILIQQID